ncbi:hypothetical protein [Tautonia rosea]|uniref:hypothetical protein n=1 Tax=Tautonia rosea TaxID=2728037 RepID=UPI001472ABBF|nr:hypothetical protein [Tautonia rosea]
MALWLGWFLDVRLHLTLLVAFLFATLLSEPSKPWPERPWRAERLVQRQQEYERSLALAAPGTSHDESLRLASGSTEAP